MSKYWKIIIIVGVLLAFTACSSEASVPNEATANPAITLAPTGAVVSTSAPERTEQPMPLATEQPVKEDPFVANFVPKQEPFAVNEQGVAYLTKEQVLEDYNYLWAFLRENVPYFDDINALLAENDQSETEIKEKFLNVITSDMTVAEYRILINSVVYEWAHSRGHIYCINSKSFFNDIINSIDLHGKFDQSGTLRNAYSKLAEMAVNKKTDSYYKAISAETGDLAVAEERSDMYYQPPEVYFDSYITLDRIDDVPYIHFKSFSIPGEEPERYFDYIKEKVKEKFPNLENEKDFIIDIRGNGGGSDSVWNRGLLPLLVKNSLTAYNLSGYIDNDYNNFLFDGGNFYYSNIYESSLGGEYIQRYPAAELHDNLIFRYMSYGTGGTASAFNGRVWLLVDKVVFSASEALTVLCKQTGFATIVGTQTGGSGAGMQPWVFSLPNSGIMIYYEATYSFNEDGTCNQVYGTKPDIDAGERNALKVCLEEILKLENSKN